MKADDLQQVRQACRDFPARFQSLQLATVSADGQPEASYAPFVADRQRGGQRPSRRRTVLPGGTGTAKSATRTLLARDASG